MADNFTGNPGAGGDVFAADDVAGIKYQRVKMVLGADGVNGGDVSGTNPMPVIFAASATQANDAWGQTLSLTNAATATIASVTAPAGYEIKGMVCHGTGDGYFTVQVASVTVLSGRTRSTQPTLVVVLPDGILVSTGAAVTLKVTNESGSTADFEGTLLGK